MVTEAQILNAMKARKVIKIWYDPVNDKKGGLSGFRDIEIYSLGYNNFGNLVIYAWIRNDFSKTLRSGRPNDAIRWRMFRIDGITRFTPTIQTYDVSQEFTTVHRPKLNALYNKAFSRLIKTVYDFNKK